MFLSDCVIFSYDDKYTLSAEFSKESRSGQGKITKSVGAYINENGEVGTYLFIYAHVMSCRTRNSETATNSLKTQQTATATGRMEITQVLAGILCQG